MPFGQGRVLATVVENRGVVDTNGTPVVTVSFFLEATAEQLRDEVAVDQLEFVAAPEARSEERISVEPAGEGWVGVYIDPLGRVAVVTGEESSSSSARKGAVQWVKEAARDSRVDAYSWQPDPKYPGRYAVYRDGALGQTLVRRGAA